MGIMWLPQLWAVPGRHRGSNGQAMLPGGLGQLRSVVVCVGACEEVGDGEEVGGGRAGQRHHTPKLVAQKSSSPPAWEGHSARTINLTQEMAAGCTEIEFSSSWEGHGARTINPTEETAGPVFLSPVPPCCRGGGSAGHGRPVGPPWSPSQTPTAAVHYVGTQDIRKQVAICKVL